MKTRFALCAALLLSLCGCFDLTETVEVHENGQGTHRIEQRVHEIGDLLSEEEVEELRAQIAEVVEQLKSDPDVLDAEGDAQVDEGDLLVHLGYTVENFQNLGRVGNQARGHALRLAETYELDGQFQFEDLGKGSWRWTYPLYDEANLAAQSASRRQSRLVQHANAEGKTAAEIKALCDAEAEQGSINYSFRAPQVLLAEGAELDGGLATWSYPLDPADELDVPEALSAEFSMSAPFPWGYALIGGGLSFGLVGGLWLRRKWQKRWE